MHIIYLRLTELGFSRFPEIHMWDGEIKMFLPVLVKVKNIYTITGIDQHVRGSVHQYNRLRPRQLQKNLPRLRG